MILTVEEIVKRPLITEKAERLVGQIAKRQAIATPPRSR